MLVCQCANSKLSQQRGSPQSRMPKLCQNPMFSSQGWPGNVRELKNTIERALVLAREGVATKAEIQVRAPSERLGARWADTCLLRSAGRPTSPNSKSLLSSVHSAKPRGTKAKPQNCSTFTEDSSMKRCALTASNRFSVLPKLITGSFLGLRPPAVLVPPCLVYSRHTRPPDARKSHFRCPLSAQNIPF